VDFQPERQLELNGTCIEVKLHVDNVVKNPHPRKGSTDRSLPRGVLLGTLASEEGTPALDGTPTGVNLRDLRDVWCAHQS